MRRLWRALYGESPLHLALLLASFALCGYALARLLSGDWWGVVQWLVGAAVVHDLLLAPLYGAADLLLVAAVRPRRSRSPLRIAVVNHIRVPAFVSLVLLLVYWPLIAQDTGPHYRAVTLLDPGVFRTRWLVITAVLFGLSGLHLAWPYLARQPRSALERLRAARRRLRHLRRRP